MDKDNKKTKLKIDTPFGLFYLILSLVVIDCAVVMTVCIHLAKIYYLVFGVAGVGILYCLILFICELIRNKKAKKADAPVEAQL